MTAFAVIVPVVVVFPIEGVNYEFMVEPAKN
jgi:hypothetical protein